MSIMNEDLAGTHTPLKKLELGLRQAAVRGKSKKDADFREAYPLLEQHLANKVPQRVVLDTFSAAYGYTLHPPRFRKMLLDERNRRAEAGDVVVCTACGHPLPSDQVAEEAAHDMEGQ